MPGIAASYEPENKAVNEIADSERVKRLEMIDMNWRYYNGDHKLPLKPSVDGHDYNIILNMCDMAIDRFVEFCGVPTLSLAGGVDNVVSAGQMEVEKTQEQEMLERLVEKSELDELIPDTLTSGAISGHNFWRIVVDSDMDGNAVTDEENLPYLVLIDPRYITSFWDQMNPRQPLFYRMQWAVGDVTYRQDIVPGWLLESAEFTVARDEWAILEYMQGKQSSKFEFVSGAVWHYPFPPIVEWKTRRKPHSYYGDHDMKAMNVNDGVNFTTSNTSKIIKHHGHPKTVLFGANAEDLQEVAPDELWTIENGEARLQSIEMQSDLQSSMEFNNFLRNFFFTKMRVLDTSVIKDRVGQLTNFGVKMLYNDMVKNVSDRRKRTANNGINEAFRRMLYMMGHEVEGVVCEWDDPLPIDRKELVEMVEKEQQFGITSNQTLAKDLKRDYVKEHAQLREEAEIAVDDRVSSLVRLAESGVN